MWTLLATEFLFELRDGGRYVSVIRVTREPVSAVKLCIDDVKSGTFHVRERGLRLKCDGTRAETRFRILWQPYCDRLCGLVVRVSGYRYRGLGFDSRRYQIF